MNGINWQEEIAKLDKKANKNDICIMKCEVEEKQLRILLENCREYFAPQCVIVEQIDKCCFTSMEKLEFEEQYLQKMRQFSEKGDLSCWRKEKDTFALLFVGDQSAGLQIKNTACWQEYFVGGQMDEEFYMREEKAVLWGKYEEKKGCWYDDRVAKAVLKYPVKEQLYQKDTRIVLHYYLYSQKGKMQFVQYKSLNKQDA